jgi:hypothetical protein
MLAAHVATRSHPTTLSTCADIILRCRTTDMTLEAQHIGAA